tara:strand:+ start:604 stop:1542 length:939 start_codon:yes stop_codon:yes gene_type:complete
MEILNEQVVTAWVLEHPAHFQLLAPFIRKGSKNDLLIITTRIECLNMYNNSENYLPNREVVFVERPFGKNKNKVKTIFTMIKRRNKVKKELKLRQKRNPIQRIIVMGASLELFSAKSAKIPQRIYISDTEIHHLAHKLALKSATDVLLPNYWREDLDNDFLKKCLNKKINIIRHNKIHAEMRIYSDNNAPNSKLICRKLKGGGSHDKKEILPIDEVLNLINENIDYFNEDVEHNNPWELCNLISNYSAVITQSTTFAAEASIQKIPTLLISRAERGFLTELISRKLPLIHCKSNLELNKNIELWNELRGFSR